MTKITQLSLLKSSLIGKKVKHTNQYRRKVILEVEDVSIENGSRDLEPATQANDWWPASESWTNYYLHFIDGSKITFNPETEIEIID